MIRQIVLIDSKRGIAKQGDQPVHLPTDGAYFRHITSQPPANILMGRTTFEVTGVLSGRQNFVVTHQKQAITGVQVVNNLDNFLASFKDDLWVIGGAAIYAATLSVSDELYVTEITTDLGCDQFYPDYLQDFELLSRSEPIQENNLEYTFCIYRRKTSLSVK